MGVASKYFPDQNCPPVQTICARHLPGNVPELGTNEIDTLELWLQGLAVRARRDVNDPEVRRGAALFSSAQCAVCHVPDMMTGKFPKLPQLSDQVFHAYTDLLLHDMGDGLADGRPDFAAGPRARRTPPLWGLGLSPTVSASTAMMHDGPAPNTSDASICHRREGASARS